MGKWTAKLKFDDEGGTVSGWCKVDQFIAAIITITQDQYPTRLESFPEQFTNGHRSFLKQVKRTLLKASKRRGEEIELSWTRLEWDGREHYTEFIDKWSAQLSAV